MTNTTTTTANDLYISTFELGLYGNVRISRTVKVTAVETYEVDQSATYHTEDDGDFYCHVTGDMYDGAGEIVECIVHSGPDCPPWRASKYFGGWSVYRI